MLDDASVIPHQLLVHFHPDLAQQADLGGILHLLHQLEQETAEMHLADQYLTDQLLVLSV